MQRRTVVTVSRACTVTALVLVTHNPAYAQRTARELLLHLGKLEVVRG